MYKQQWNQAILMQHWLLKCTLTIKQHVEYLAVLNGADAIIFTAGIGENAANVREDVISGISWFGCDVDPEKTSLV